MTIRTRLLRRPGTTALWLILTLVMSGFLTAAASLWLGTRQLAAELDGKHTAIAVRTDRAVTGSYQYEGRTLVGASYSVEERTLDRAELDWLEGQPSVKAVRIHSLSGGYSEAFESVLGLRREQSFRSVMDPQSYRRCLAAVTVLGKEANDNVLFGVEEILCLHPEFMQTLTATDPNDIDKDYLCYLGIEGILLHWEDNGVDPSFFEVGERYLLSGQFYSDRLFFNRPLVNARIPNVYAPRLSPGMLTVREDGLLWVPGSYDPADQSHAAYGYPAAQKLEGSVEEFLAAHPVWEEYRQTLNRQLNSLPVLGTERLESLYMFVKNEAAIVEGRSFTPEEYESGARVLVLSDAVAAKHGLQVGDKVSMAQFLCGESANPYASYNPSTDLYSVNGQLKWPAIGQPQRELEYGPREEYEIVGVYRLSDYWSLGSYAFTPDTVFIPKKAQIEGAWGPESEDLYGVYLSVELVNGMLDDFKLALAGSPYAGRYYTVDQGFEQVQRNLNDLRLNARRLALTALAAWGIFVLLYLMMYQAGQRHNLGILRSQGSGIPAARRYLFLGGLIVAALGVVIGTLLSTVVLNRVEQNILSDMLAQIDRSAAETPLISEDDLGAMVRACGLNLGQALLLGAAQLGLLAGILWVHAAILARKNPRRLMEV